MNLSPRRPPPKVERATAGAKKGIVDSVRDSLTSKSTHVSGRKIYNQPKMHKK